MDVAQTGTRQQRPCDGTSDLLFSTCLDALSCLDPHGLFVMTLGEDDGGQFVAHCSSGVCRARLEVQGKRSQRIRYVLVMPAEPRARPRHGQEKGKTIFRACTTAYTSRAKYSHHHLLTQSQSHSTVLVGEERKPMSKSCHLHYSSSSICYWTRCQCVLVRYPMLIV